MAKQTRRVTTLHLRIVEEFTDEEPASLPGVPTYETTAEEQTAPLAKCAPFPFGKVRAS